MDSLYIIEITGVLFPLLCLLMSESYGTCRLRGTGHREIWYVPICRTYLRNMHELIGFKQNPTVCTYYITVLYSTSYVIIDRCLSRHIPNILIEVYATNVAFQTVLARVRSGSGFFIIYY